MFVCICKGVSDSQIKEAVAKGVGTYAEVREQFGVGTCCGMCAVDIKKIVIDHVLAKQLSFSA